MQDELCRIKDDVIEPDKGITNEDKIMLLEAWGGKAEEEFLEAVARREKREAKKLENKT